jgi:hypothetical protein
MYKRMSSRDFTVAADVEDNSGKSKYLSSQVIQCIFYFGGINKYRILYHSFNSIVWNVRSSLDILHSGL